MNPERVHLIYREGYMGYGIMKRSVWMIGNVMRSVLKLGGCLAGLILRIVVLICGMLCQLALKMVFWMLMKILLW